MLNERRKHKRIYTSMLVFIIIIALVYVALYGIGYATLRWLGLRNCLSMGSPAVRYLLRVAICICVGQGIFTLLLWCSSFVGGFVIAVWVGLVAGFFVSVWQLFCSITTLRNHELTGIRSSYWIGILAIIGASSFLATMYAKISLGLPFESIPSIGNWAYKAKIIYLQQGLSAEYFTHYAYVYGKFSYPSGFAILNATLYTVWGGVEEQLLRINNMVLMLLSFALVSAKLLFRMGYWGLLSVVAVVMLYLSEGAAQMVNSLYSEPLLLFCCATSLSLLAAAPKFGKVLDSELFQLSIVCAGCAAWVKQEGILFFLLQGFLGCCILWKQGAKLKPVLLTFVAVLLIFIAPWTAVVKAHRVQDSDFHFDKFKNTMTHPKVGITATHFVHKTKQGNPYSFLWMIAPLLLVARFMRSLVMLLPLLIALLLLCAYLHSMAWSKVDLVWHLSSLDRYLFLPTLCVFFSLVFIFARNTPTQKPKPLNHHEQK